MTNHNHFVAFAHGIGEIARKLVQEPDGADRLRELIEETVDAISDYYGRQHESTKKRREVFASRMSEGLSEEARELLSMMLEVP